MGCQTLRTLQMMVSQAPVLTAREALRLASHKLPIRCKFVKREELDTVKEGDAE